ncbi:hypothetical protein [Actinoallomurus iriomotensis]|jgi:hypothetical protein|uniref:Uncharacterized protein n=1 Tax=Actinoallomurus iriomotensis TaxID=478107 RepID=A0A9W6S5Q8_9ACTN|nr:hypothetical protein [Actinoallomurus iriomotensis]GLY79356.1 hypothetical protein Airi01_076230 [Actinoallomurus iriomotensis]GLY86202.1 hypothetical protein Airi02_041310 [Actinoallomurus iriomotensis]
MLTLTEPRDAGVIEPESLAAVPSEAPEFQANSCTVCHWGMTKLCDDFSTQA